MVQETPVRTRNPHVQTAFDKIKQYLLNPPILVPSMPGYPLILYLAVQETSIGCMLGQVAEPDQKERVIYYLSKKFTSCEINYITIEKTCYALAWASRKLQKYMHYYASCRSICTTTPCNSFSRIPLSTSLKSQLSQERSPIGKCCSPSSTLCL